MFPSPLRPAVSRLWHQTAAACLLGVLAAALSGAAIAAPDPAPAGPAASAAETDKQDYSAAERLLFMTPQLGQVKPGQTLRYSFRHSGAFEPGFDDKVSVTFNAEKDGSCCAARSEFLSAERRLELPEVPAAEGNPVILYFLERDVREMQRLTKGSQNHFRKRIRMAIYGGATVREMPVRWQGRTVTVSEISFTPFLDDPNRPKYEKFVRKEYHFLLSEAVPGGVYGIRTQINAQDGRSEPLIVDEMYADGAEPKAAAL